MARVAKKKKKEMPRCTIELFCRGVECMYFLLTFPSTNRSRYVYTCIALSRYIYIQVDRDRDRHVKVYWGEKMLFFFFLYGCVVGEKEYLYVRESQQCQQQSKQIASARRTKKKREQKRRQGL